MSFMSKIGMLTGVKILVKIKTIYALISGFTSRLGISTRYIFTHSNLYLKVNEIKKYRYVTNFFAQSSCT